MITTEAFLAGLLVVSTLTGLTTEALKKMFVELKVDFPPNTLAAIVSAILSVAIGAGYVVLASVTFNASVVIYIIALAFASWLCAMVGYDKVIGSFKK